MAAPFPSEMYVEIQERFENTIKCSCSNSDWRMFIYVSAGDRVIAGCKLCGRTQEFRDAKDLLHP